MNRVDYPALVVGAGPAGLATSHQLQRRGIEHLVLEQGGTVAHMWRSLYDSLRLHTGKHLSALPGMRFPASVALFPSRAEFLDYVERYTAGFRLPVAASWRVTRAERHAEGWRVGSDRGELSTRALVVATGILSNPYVPELAGQERFRGSIIHSREYRRPAPFVKQRVLVVGVGNSSGEISSELALAGTRVTVAVRSGALALPRQLLGIPIQYFSCLMAWMPRRVQRAIIEANGWAAQLWRGRVLPRPAFSHCPDVPLIGFHLVDAIRQGSIQMKGNVERFTEDGARFSDGSEERFDHVILATGYRAAIGWLHGSVRIDECGFAARRRRVRSTDQPGLYFVGHNYDGRGGLVNIAQDSKLAARAIASQLG